MHVQKIIKKLSDLLLSCFKEIDLLFEYVTHGAILLKLYDNDTRENIKA